MRILVERHTIVEYGIPLGLASVAALAAQIWEWAICFSDEVEYLWRGKFRCVKLLYVCSRYLLLSGQIANQVLLFLNHAQKHRIDQDTCPGMFIFKSLLTQVGLVILETVLFLRVYALYNQTSKAKWFLLMFFFVSSGLELCGTGIFIHSISNVSGCGLLRADNKSVYFFGAGVGLAQFVLVLAILVELISKHRLRRLRTPLTSMVLQQGVASCFLVLTLIAVLMVYNFFSYLDETAGEAMLSWYYAFISIGTSRLILEMWKLPISEAEDHSLEGEGSGEVHLTTFNESMHLNATNSAWITMTNSSRPITTNSTYPSMINSAYSTTLNESKK